MNIDQVWKNTQEELKVVLAPAVYQTFVAQTQLISLQNQTAQIACPNAYLVDMNKKRYYHLFKSALDNQLKTDTQLSFILQQSVRLESEPQTIGPLFSLTPSDPSLSLGSAAVKAGLHPKYTFDTLIVGNSNNFAFAAAQGIVKNPGLSYNPFFIWGGVGVGKTHLMQAIGHELLKNNPEAKIKYFPAETFGNELIFALKAKTINQFKEKYRHLDCILVDDIQFIAGKEYIQEEFFHTFNALHLAGKQIILTSDRKPSEIQHLEDRLVSRFMGGLTVDIQLPDFEMRSAIIYQKAQEFGLHLTSEAITYLAQNLTSNIRDINGRLQELSIQIIANKTQSTQAISLNSIQQYFPTTTFSSPTSFATPTNPRHVISLCAKYFDVKTGDLCGQCRKKELVAARHITAYLLLTESNLPLEEVGRLLGGRDHTSIMHARDKISTDLSTNKELRQQISQIKSSF